MTDDASRAPAPPRADVRPVQRSAHGLTWTDAYAWIRAENWREVLRDPSRLPSDVRALLEAENAYADATLAPTADLKKELAREMRARLREDDSEPPQVDGPWAYYARYREGGQRRIYGRRPREGGDETILLDGDARAEGKAYYHVAAASHAPDHTKLAWAADELGSEMLTICLRDLDRGEDLSDRIVNATDDMAWTRDSKGLLYVEQDESHRPFRVMLHRLGTEQREDEEVLAEPDPAWFIGLQATRLGQSALIVVHGHDASETRVIDLDHPVAPPLLIAPRRPGLFYDVMDHGDCFYIRANSNARDFKIVVAPRDAPDEASWRDVVPHRDGHYIAEATLFRNFLVLVARKESLPRLVVRELTTGETRDVLFDEETCALALDTVYEFDSQLARIAYSAMDRPEETIDYDCATGARTLVKKQETPGFDPERYLTRLLFARAEDGESVPVSILMRRDLALDSSAPLLLYGYGAYGHAIEASFSSNRLSLVDRGFIYAIAHVRGGTDKGWRWYEDGKLSKKPNTFGDFLAAARRLIAGGYTRAGRIVAQGASAGGLLMGAVANAAPDLFAGIIADVPFVDALTTMLDDSLPLTPPEWLEWGDPLRDPAAFETIRSYSPLDNVKPQRYPAVLALAGLTDPRVTYWEPAKWVAKLRATMTGGGPILLRTAMEAGHAGQPGRFDRLDDIARNYAFAIACVRGGLRLSEPT
jgi:oligopeptidase B